MEELLPIIIIFVVSSIVSAVKKNQAQQAAAERHRAASAARVKTAQERMQAAAKVEPARPMAYADVPGPVITPTVHTHVQPDCETHDAPGSLGYVSTEGKDPCHEPQLTHARTIDVEVPQEGGLTFDWSGDSMVKAVVMQEVLTRPTQRRAR